MHPLASSIGIEIRLAILFFVQPNVEVPVGPSLAGAVRAGVAPPRHRSSAFLDVLRELFHKEGVVGRAAIQIACPPLEV